jgi:hypothetical protein
MSTEDSAANRWILREGWYFAGWTVNRQMVRGHAPLGLGVAALGAIASPLMAWLVEPSLAVVGLPFVIAGTTITACAHYISSNPRVPHEAAPKLSDRAQQFLKKVLAEAAPLPLFDPHYNGRKMRPAPKQLKRSVAELLHPHAFESFEALCRAYNRASAAAIDSVDVSEDAYAALRQVMADGLDSVAALQEFPESPEPQTTQLRNLVAKLDEFSQLLEQRLIHAPHSLSPSLSAWVEALRQDHAESLHERA